MKTPVKSDYQMAKEAVEKLKLLEEATYTVKSVTTFRKYLRDMQLANKPKRLITNEVDGKIIVTRIK